MTTYDTDELGVVVDRHWLSGRLGRAGVTLYRFCESHHFSANTRMKLRLGKPLRPDTYQRVVRAANGLEQPDDVPPEAMGRSA